MSFSAIHNSDELIRLVQSIGFLPFFEGNMQGFSLEECTPQELWFVDGVDGPWEWKSPAITKGHLAYSKFFRGKAGYISEDWYADFANVRRSGIDFYEAYDAGLIPRDEKLVYDTLRENGSMQSRRLKSVCGFGKNGRKGFDTIITRLQMQGYVVIEDFEYSRDKFGQTYGWGIARYTTPEAFFGDDFMDIADGREPEESLDRILRHLAALLPQAEPKRLQMLIER